MNLKDETEMDVKAECFEFIIATAFDDDLSDWVDFVSDGVKGPDTLEEAYEAFANLVKRAKADGVYPVKTKA